MNKFKYKQGKANIAFRLPGEYVWDVSIVQAEGKYWMFSSHWPFSKGFGWNWLYISQICLSVSDKPEGPYKFVKNVLPPRGREYWDGMNTHNTCIKYYNGKFYLYYMGVTYDCDIPNHCSEIKESDAIRLWNTKRIGLAISDKVDGEYIRSDKPLFEPRKYPCWDSTITTNPSVLIKKNGETVMLYKSALYEGDERTKPLKVGVAIADKPEGPFKRLCDHPILDSDDDSFSIEDPFIWWDEEKKKYCVVMKDCIGNIARYYGNLFYAESDDCQTFEIEDDPTVITRDVEWEDGHKTRQCNFERPFVLFDKNGKPTHIFGASGDGLEPFNFTKETYILCIKLEEEK